MIRAAQYAAPFENDFVPLEEFNDKYRGGHHLLEVQPRKGRIEPEKSFIVEAPPYSQDLSDAGKARLTAGRSPTRSAPSVTSAVSSAVAAVRGRLLGAKDTDFLHMINWKKAERTVQGRQDQEDQRRQRAADGRRRGQRRRAVPDPRGQEPARRRRVARTANT